MRLRINKSRRRTRRNTKKKTLKKQKGANQQSKQFEVFYGTTKVTGQELSKQLTQSEPTIKFPNTNTTKLYTLIMWDPDVPPQIQPGFAHWIAINLKSPNDILDNQLLDYKGPSPPSGTHRYFFGLFEQINRISPHQPERTQFNIEEFIQQNNLKKVAEVFMKVSAI
jgi:phosphatidylethanolamine-binding protein (PEBP) family uncharacterized protein